MARMTGAKFMADTLKAYGVTHVFLVPAILRRALAEMDLIGIKRVITHGEKAAAYMADGYARASGKPGVCMAQSVGAANLAAGLQDAYLGLSPVIALTGHKRSDEQYRNAYQEIEHSKPFASVTKFSAVVDNAEQLPHLLRQAFREATTGAPAPVHLDIQGMTGDFATEAEADLEVLFEATFAQRPAFRPEADLESVRAAARALTSAQRPVIVAGGGVTSSGAQQEVVELAEMLQIPVATSLNAKGAITDNHPLAVGVVGSYSRWCANRVVSEADLVFYIGSHTGSQVTNEWRVPSPGTRVIQIDIDPRELGRTYPAEVAMHGDAKATLRRMIEALEPIGGRADWTARAQQLVQEWRDDVAPRANSDAVPIIPERLCNEITEFLPSDAMLVADTGHSGIWTGSMIDFNHPTQELHSLRRLAGLGAVGGHGRQVRPARPSGAVLQRRRRLLVSHSRAGNGGAQQHQRRHRHQQQQRPQPGPARRRAGLRRSGRRTPRGAVAVPGHQLRGSSRVHRLLRHPRRAPRRHPERAGAGVCVGAPRGGGRGDGPAG